MFKVGDKVIIVNNYWGHGWEKGDIVQLTELSTYWRNVSQPTFMRPICNRFDASGYSDKSIDLKKTMKWRALRLGDNLSYFVINEDIMRIVPKLNKQIQVL